MADDFLYYRSGIYTGEGCVGVSLNHAMQAVGFGTDSRSGDEYVIIRNQWGTSWGINGYAKVRLDRGTTGVCGVYTDNTFTLVGYDPSE